MRAAKRTGARKEQTPVAEWIAASVGLALTLSVIAFTVWEGVVEDPAPPRLIATAEPAVRAGDGYVVPITVRNESHATAAEVSVRAELQRDGAASEERTTRFTYVPGRGEARGGLIFEHDPGGGRLDLVVEGFAEP